MERKYPITLPIGEFNLPLGDIELGGTLVYNGGKLTTYPVLSMILDVRDGKPVINVERLDKEDITYDDADEFMQFLDTVPSEGDTFFGIPILYYDVDLRREFMLYPDAPWHPWVYTGVAATDDKIYVATLNVADELRLDIVETKAKKFKTI